MKYYEQIKDPSDTTSVLCKWVNETFSSAFSIFFYFLNSHVFAVFDKDHNGKIDFHEFLLAVAAGTPNDIDSHLDYIFEM
jgi:hypothetical protein